MPEDNLEHLLLLVRHDGAVRGGVGHAGQHEALAHLVVVKERLVALVDRARRHLARARRAGARAARVGQVNALLLGLVQDVHVVRALDGLCGAGRVGQSTDVISSRSWHEVASLTPSQTLSTHTHRPTSLIVLAQLTHAIGAQGTPQRSTQSRSPRGVLRANETHHGNPRHGFPVRAGRSLPRTAPAARHARVTWTSQCLNVRPLRGVRRAPHAAARGARRRAPRRISAKQTTAKHARRPRGAPLPANSHRFFFASRRKTRTCSPSGVTRVTDRARVARGARQSNVRARDVAALARPTWQPWHAHMGRPSRREGAPRCSARAPPAINDVPPPRGKNCARHTPDTRHERRQHLRLVPLGRWE